MGIRVAVAGASGYAGGELLRLLAGHPELDLVAATAHSQAGHRSTASTRTSPGSTWCSPRPTRRPWPTRTWSSSPCRTAQSAALAAAAAGRRCRSSTCGADHRLRRRRRLGQRTTAATHAGAWTYGLPELPGQRDADRRRRPGSPSTGCYAAAIIAGARAAGRRRRRPTRPTWWWSPPPAPPAPAGRPRPHLLGSEVMGDLSPYKVGRAPARPGDQAGHRRDRRCRSPRCWRRCRAASWPPSPRAGRAGVDADDVRAVLAEAYARRAVRARAARRAAGRTPRRRSAPTPCHLQATRRRRLRPGDRASARSTTWARAPPARPCSAPTSLLGLPETTGLSDRSGVAP